MASVSKKKIIAQTTSTGGGGGGVTSNDISNAKFTGKYWSPSGNSPAADLLVQADNVFFMPFPVGSGFTTNSMRANILGLSIGENFRMALYRDNGTGLPGNLIVESANISTTTAGLKTFGFTSVTFTASEKIFWHAIRWSGGAATFSTRIYPFFISDGVDPEYRIFTGAYGAFPANGSASVAATGLGSNFYPVIGFNIV